MLYWRYCKDMQTSYFGYFGHAWLHTPKIIKSTCTRLWCLSVCKKQTSSFILFLRYYILKNPAIWLAVPIWGLEFCQIWDWWWNINNNISFHFRLSSRKTNDKFFLKIQKEPILGPFWALFTRIWAKMKRKTPNWRTDRQTDRQTDDGDFIRPSVGKFLRIICLVHTQNSSKLNLSPSI